MCIIRTPCFPFAGLINGVLMKLNRKLILVSMLYFAEGLPFGIIEQTFPVYFRIKGMSLVDMGLLSLVGIPYALKFLWAPAIDFVGARRHWISAAQLLMAASIIVLLPLDPAAPTTLFWVMLVTFAVLSASQDIAIDAYTIELLNASEMGMANGFRQAAYRVALVLSGGLFIALGGWMGWKFTYFIAAGILAVCGLISLYLPHIEVQRPRFSINSLVAPIQDLLKRPGVIQVACFILLFKLGDLAIGPMVRPFWLDQGLTTTEIGLITGTIGVFAGIAGALAGGVYITRRGIYRGLWVLGLWQSLSNLSYSFIAAYPGFGAYGIYLASFFESFCGGLGTSAFLAFLMSICKKEFSATQYALLSALFRISGTIAASSSGWVTQDIGYAYYFTWTFILSIPAFLFIPYTKVWIPDEAKMAPS